MNTKWCAMCEKELPLSEFYTHKDWGYQSRCKTCQASYRKQYNKTPQAKTSRRKTYEKLRDKGYFRDYNTRQYHDPIGHLKMVARLSIHKMKREGLIDQQPCLMCGKQYTEAHHPDYDQPLLIVWLCHSCHIDLHNNIKLKENG
ncbi:hypothetical protein LCGC14_1558560 [marine sediment metagenome]|uniref:Uncharacterized protein n=1 Tax=marine sediment metagenome TaxID=412755 RepID=A0A0F9IN63_9ZZZZ